MKKSLERALAQVRDNARRRALLHRSAARSAKRRWPGYPDAAKREADREDLLADALFDVAAALDQALPPPQEETAK